MNASSLAELLLSPEEKMRFRTRYKCYKQRISLGSTITIKA